MNAYKVVLGILSCIVSAGLALYGYIDKTNELTELRLIIPQVSRELKRVQEENIRLKYEVDQFESPPHLMELQRKPEFSYLKYPFLEEEIILLEGSLDE